MEGAMDSRRLVLTRPTPRPVAARRVKSADVEQPVSVMNDHIADSIALPSITEVTRPQFSKLTPIYQSSPVNSPSKVNGSRFKGLEFVKTHNKSKSAKTSNNKDLTNNVVSKADAAFQPISHRLEDIESNIDLVDLDLMVGPVNDEVEVAEVFGTAIKTLDYQPVNFIEQYFQRGTGQPTMKYHIKSLIPKVKQSIKNVNPKHVRRIGVLSVLTGIMVFGGYVLADSFLLNQEAKAVLAKESTSASSEASAPVLTETRVTEAQPSSDATQTTAGTSEQPASTAVNHGAGYSVPADQPKYITIKKLGIHAPVVSLGLTSAGAVDTPNNIWNAGWYNGSAKPGTNGATLIDGHSSASKGALFGHLDELNAGDNIQIERGDGSMLTYKVAYKAIVNRNNVDMASMLTPYGNASSGLNIITCTGKWINSEKTLENRVLIYTQQI